MSKILIVDDKEMMRDSVATTLARKGHVVSTASCGKAAIEKITARRPDAVITDLQMPEMDGLELLAEIRAIDEHLPVLFMTAYGTVETAVAAMKKGAYDYITKPFSGDELLVAVDRAIDHQRVVRENQILRAAASPNGAAAASHAHAVVGSSPVMQALLERLHKIADSHGTVFVSGESGAGKEVAARLIHERSPRAQQPFLAINCAALSTSLLESELFGHEKGAFTGADKLRRGRFELADGGTLLLDEISEIAPSIQAKLLRVLQEQSFERVGSSRSLSVDVRVIATSNRDLPAEVARGTFRSDLYYRLNVLPLEMPPLRDHIDDLPELTSHFLARVGAREGKPTKTLTPDAITLLGGYAWPGNVRELQNICERAAVLTAGDRIEAGLVAPWLGPLPSTVARMAPVLAPQHSNVQNPASTVEMKPSPNDAIRVVCDGDLTLDDLEREAIIATLQHNNGHRQRSAKALGIGVRTLGLKLKKWKEQQIVSQELWQAAQDRRLRAQSAQDLRAAGTRRRRFPGQRAARRLLPFGDGTRPGEPPGMIEGLTNADSIPALERMLQFAGGRHRLIAHNVANIDTPNFRPIDVSVESFQAQLGEAIDDARERNSAGGGRLSMRDTDEVAIVDGEMVLRPKPIGDNILFHDGSDADPERLMQALVENFMAFRAAADLLRSRFDIINTAIRERI